MSRTYALSIITATDLVGLPRFLFSKRGVSEAVESAYKLGFKVQMLPLHLPFGMGESLDSVITQHTANIVTFEDRWGPWTHPWKELFTRNTPLMERIKAVIAYHLFFSLSQRKNDSSLDRLSKTGALSIDCPSLKDSALEVSPHGGKSPNDWHQLVSEKIPVVIDTHHLMEYQDLDHEKFLSDLMERNAKVAAIHIQFRDRQALQEFLSCGADTKTGALLTLIKPGSATAPVVLELPPGLATVDELSELRKKVSKILD